MHALQVAARSQRASVEPGEVERYERYNAQHGARLGAEAVVTGSVGPKAYKALQAAGIRIALIEAVCPGTEALRRFKEGGLPVLDKPNSEGHWI